MEKQQKAAFQIKANLFNKSRKYDALLIVDKSKTSPTVVYTILKQK